eukprot:34153-Chlamydomonas_euryale.AAC.2
MEGGNGRNRQGRGIRMNMWEEVEKGLKVGRRAAFCVVRTCFLSSGTCSTCGAAMRKHAQMAHGRPGYSGVRAAACAGLPRAPSCCSSACAAWPASLVTLPSARTTSGTAAISIGRAAGSPPASSSTRSDAHSACSSGGVEDSAGASAPPCVTCLATASATRLRSAASSGKPSSPLASG